VQMHVHMRTQSPMQPGSATGHCLFPGAPCGRSVFGGAAANHRSMSAGPLEVATGLPQHGIIVQNQRLMRTQSPMQPGRVAGHGKPPRGPCGLIVAADHRSKSDPLNAALARADQTILGQARSPLISPRSEARSPMISSRFKVKSGYNGTNGIMLPTGTALPKPSIPKQGSWEPILDGPILPSPTISPTISPRIVGYMSF